MTAAYKTSSSPAPGLDGYDDFRAFCNPLVVTRAELTSEPYRLVRCQKGVLYDLDGQAVQDFLAGWGTQAFGHRHPHIADALSQFLQSDSPSFFSSGISPYAGQLARRLCERTGFERAFFASGGSEAVEAALKLARAATGKPKILCLQGAYHGCTFGSCALMHPGSYRDRFAPHLPEVQALPYEDVEALARALGQPEVGAIIVEPLQVEGGVRSLSESYLSALCELTSRHQVLLIADEIQTGLGRCGKFLASAGWPRPADVVVLGKALGGGLMPVSCLLTRDEIFSRAYGDHANAEAHASTFSGNAMACVAGLAFCDLLTDPAIARAAQMGDWFRARLREALGELPLVESVRGEGLMSGIVLRQADHPWLNFDYLGLSELLHQPAVGLLVSHRLFKAGFLTNVCAHDWRVLRVHPQLDITQERLSAFVDACRTAVEYLCQLQ